MSGEKINRIRVLHIATSIGGGGAETMLCNLLERMPNDLFEHIVVSTSGQVNPVHRQKIERYAARLHELDGGSLYNPVTLWKLGKVIRRERPNLIQTWTHKADFFGGLVARFAMVRNVVWGLHSLQVYHAASDSAFRVSLFRRLVSFASHWVPRRIVSCSQVGIRSHHEMGYPEDKMLWIGNGVDTSRFKPDTEARRSLRATLSIPEEAHVVGYVGRFAPVKDFPTLFAAVAAIQERDATAHFVCCGDEGVNELPEIESLVAKLPDRSRFHVIPFRDDIEKVYPAFDLCALTSTSEAFPMVIIEAMACGVPFVSTDVGDAREMIGDGGKTVPVGSPSAMADAWESLLGADAQKRSQLGLLARGRCCELFGLDTTIGKYRDLYLELAS